jgi:hypothetical protein
MDWDNPHRPNSPFFNNTSNEIVAQKIVDDIIDGRVLCYYYEIAILGCIALFAIAHWCNQIPLKVAFKSTRSSRHTDDDQSPLLFEARVYGSKLSSLRSWVSRLSRRIKAAAQHQPASFHESAGVTLFCTSYCVIMFIFFVLGYKAPPNPCCVPDGYHHHREHDSSVFTRRQIHPTNVAHWMVLRVAQCVPSNVRGYLLVWLGHTHCHVLILFPSRLSCHPSLVFSGNNCWNLHAGHHTNISPQNSRKVVRILLYCSHHWVCCLPPSCVLALSHCKTICGTICNCHYL